MTASSTSTKFEFDFQEFFYWGSRYLALGLRIIRLHGIYPDGRCTCGNPDCRVGLSRSAGKHPVAKNWGDSYARSEDDLMSWDDGKPFNIGVVLGPEGGVIDCEDDSPEAKAYRESLGLADYDTPTWTSGRSTHQLTRWDDRLKGISKVEPGGLECRVGDGAQIQSVLPPSWHHSGVRYTWKPGMSVEDIGIAPTPKDLVRVIVNHAEAGGGKSKNGNGKAYSGPLIFREVSDGEGRHKAILMWAWDKIVNDRDPLDARRRSVITKEILDANEKYLKPPKAVADVLQVINSCFAEFHKRSERGWQPTAADRTEESIVREAETIADGGADAVAVTGFEAHGLERVRIGEVDAWKPGNWKIQMVQGDPPEVILCVPAWSKTPCKGRIQMTFDTFRSASKVAAAVFLATRRVILDGDTAKWLSAWKGVDASKKTNGQSVPGLMEQLVARKAAEDDIQVGTSGLRYAALAGFLLESLRRATRAKEGPEAAPNTSGRPCWVTDDEMWFQWGKAWEDIGIGHDVQPGERQKLKNKLLEAMDATDLPHKRHRFQSGQRMEFVVFDRKWLATLEDLASGGSV